MMTRSRLQTILPFALVTVLVVAALGVAWAAVSKGDKAADFKLKTLSGKTLSLSQIRANPAKKGTNRVVILDFWATWCGPCRAELPIFQRLHQKYAKKGVAIVGIAVDKGGVDDVKPFVQKQSLTYTVLVDPKSEVSRPYGVRYLPTTFVIDKTGKVHEIHVGFDKNIEEILDKEIQALLK